MPNEFDEDDEDDRPLGAKPVSVATRLESPMQEEEEAMDEDMSLESSRKRRNRDDDGSSSSKRLRAMDFDGFPDERRQRDEQLFEDARALRSMSDRRLERAVANITLEMLEGVRLKQERLLHMLEHPKFEEYIRGAYVRYPDLEKIQADNTAPEHVKEYLPAQITKCIHLDEPEKLRIDGDRQISMPYELTVLQYTSRIDGSLKIRKGRLDLAHVQSDPFRPEELERWRELLRLFSGRAGSDKLQTLPEMLSTTADRLRGFTFTTEDVDAILKRKVDGKFGWAASLNWRDLYLRKSELEFELQDLQSSEEDVDSARVEAINQELSEIRKRLAVLRKEEEEAANNKGPRLEGLRMTPRVRVKGPDTQMLTPRFLQAKGVDQTPTRNLDWTMLDSFRKFGRPVWSTGQYKADSSQPQLESVQAWKDARKVLVMKLASKLPVATAQIEHDTEESRCRLSFPPIQLATGEAEPISLEAFYELIQKRDSAKA